MSKKNFFKTGLMLIAVLAFTVKLTAADIIKLTWSQTQSSGYKCFTIKATSGKTYTINWGDGSAVETKTGTGSSQVLSHAYTGTSNRNVIITAGSNCKFTSFVCSDDCNSGGLESNNRVSSLTFTDCSDLGQIDCRYNLLSSLSLSGLSSLGSLRCNGNSLTSLTLTGCETLESLDCFNNLLTSLDLSGCPNLVFLSCQNNNLTTLTGNSAVPSVDCSNNLFTTFTGWSNLSDLTCDDNELTNLDLSACSDLLDLSCNNNLLTNLDINACPFLRSLRCDNNKLQLSNLFEIHSRISEQNYKWLGTQNLQPQEVSTQQLLFSDQSVFNNIYTSYTITKNGNPAPTSDYTVTQGKLMFNHIGTYTVTMDNTAIISHESYPAKTIVVLTVEEGLPVVDAQTPAITAQPQSATYSQNATAAALSITAIITDGGTLSYQWYSNTTNSTTGGTAVGTNSNTYTPTTTTVGTTYYYVVVTNTNNLATGATTATVTSNIAIIAVNTLVNAEIPVITTQPQSATYSQNATAAALSVTASVTDGGMLSHQWYSNTTNSTTGGAAVGTNSNTYTPATTTVGTTYYYVVITNTNDNATGETTAAVTSNSAMITVNSLVNAEMPVITTQPQSATYSQNATATALSITAIITDGGTLSYQWYSNTTNSTTDGTAVGTNSNTYTPTTTTLGTTYYYVVVTNTNDNSTGETTAAVTSNSAMITVNTLINAEIPVITAQPQNATYNQNAIATALSITANITDDGILSYQWYSNTTNSTIGGTPVGTNNNTYTPSTTTVGTTYYYVIVTNTNDIATGATTATITSNTAMVKINAGVIAIASLENDATLKLYPNPVKDQLYIVMPNEITVLSEQIQIYDFSGKLVLVEVVTNPRTEINISHLHNGMYIVKIGNISARIVKQ